ncbi:thiamine pyrophosphate-binding protein [Pseudonocardia bannensis]|uniref:thiamine pyrophosphate-binding protein n=1 Tax=Pseudonocardia bannensis TaxID=630973 RepID=UPI00146B046C|nr:thiamine pyrophosphate-binding protein [Pseudonocardia bannensis]
MSTPTAGTPGAAAHNGNVPRGLDWQVAVADRLLAGGVTVAAYVPDSRLDGLLARLGEHGLPLRSLTREEECVGYAAGQRIAGRRPVVLMQSSGVGNALNAIGSLVVPYRLGLPLIISMRGTLGERNPSQVPMGRATASFLGALGIQSFPMRRDSDAAGVTDGVLGLAFGAQESAALLLEPDLGGGREHR